MIKTVIIDITLMCKVLIEDMEDKTDSKKDIGKPRRKSRTDQWGPRPNQFTCKRCKKTFWTRKAQDEHTEKECGELQAKRWKRSTIVRVKERRGWETNEER